MIYTGLFGEAYRYRDIIYGITQNMHGIQKQIFTAFMRYNLVACTAGISGTGRVIIGRSLTAER